MLGSRTATHARLPLAGLALLLSLAACEAGSSGTPAPSAAASLETVAAQSAVDAVESMEGDFSCADPIPRADDYAWLCEGSRDPVTATVHLYSTNVDGPIFGATLYTSAPPTADEGEASVEATRTLAHDLVEAAVPPAWRQPAVDWIDAHMPDGGRTRDVEGAGITAAVQPLAAQQWYLELYELDGLESGG